VAGSPVTDNSTGLRELGERAISDGAPGAQGMGALSEVNLGSCMQEYFIPVEQECEAIHKCRYDHC